MADTDIPDVAPWDALIAFGQNPPERGFWTYEGTDTGGNPVFACPDGLVWGGDSYTVRFHVHPEGGGYVFGSMWAQDLDFRNYDRAVGGIDLYDEVRSLDGLRAVVLSLSEWEVR